MSNTRLEEIKQRNSKTKPGSMITFSFRNQGSDLQRWVSDYHNDTSFLLQELEKLQEERDMYRRKYEAAYQRCEETLQYLGEWRQTKSELEKLQQENERYKEGLYQVKYEYDQGQGTDIEVCRRIYRAAYEALKAGNE